MAQNAALLTQQSTPRIPGMSFMDHTVASGDAPSFGGGQPRLPNPSQVASSVEDYTPLDVLSGALIINSRFQSTDCYLTKETAGDDSFTKAPVFPFFVPNR